MTSIIYPASNLKSQPNLVIEKGDGVYVFDNKGKKYLEAMSGLWCTSLGYNSQKLIDAAKIPPKIVEMMQANAKNLAMLLLLLGLSVILVVR